jgi:hypothetical protein
LTALVCACTGGRESMWVPKAMHATVGSEESAEQVAALHDSVCIWSMGATPKPSLARDQIAKVERRMRPPVAWGDEYVDDLPELVDGAIDISPAPGDLHMGLLDADSSPFTPAGAFQQDPHHEQHRPACACHALAGP